MIESTHNFNSKSFLFEMHKKVNFAMCQDHDCHIIL